MLAADDQSPYKFERFLQVMGPAAGAKLKIILTKMPTTMLEITICIPQAYFHADVTQTNSVTVVKIPIDKDTTIASCSEEHLLLTWNPISSVVRFYDGAANASHLEPYQFSCSLLQWSRECFSFGTLSVQFFA